MPDCTEGLYWGFNVFVVLVVLLVYNSHSGSIVARAERNMSSN